MVTLGFLSGFGPLLKGEGGRLDWTLFLFWGGEL